MNGKFNFNKNFGRLMETLIDFVKRISAETKCFFHVTKSGVVSLKKMTPFRERTWGVWGGYQSEKDKINFAFKQARTRLSWQGL